MGLNNQGLASLKNKFIYFFIIGILFFLAGCLQKPKYSSVATECNKIMENIYKDLIYIKYGYKALENFTHSHVKEAPLKRPADCRGSCEPWDFAKISYQSQSISQGQVGKELKGIFLSINFVKRPNDTSRYYTPVDQQIYIKRLGYYLQCVIRSNDFQLQMEIMEIVKRNAS